MDLIHTSAAVPAAAATAAAPDRRKWRRGHTPVFHPGTPLASTSSRSSAATSSSGRAAPTSWAVPLPRRKVALLQRQPEQTVLPLLRLRQTATRSASRWSTRCRLRRGGQDPRSRSACRCRRRTWSPQQRPRPPSSAKAGHAERRAPKAAEAYRAQLRTSQRAIDSPCRASASADRQDRPWLRARGLALPVDRAA